jgi:NADPH:quinone reductase-like Zn-dependent oxidoreductase
MGADFVLNHHEPLRPQLEAIGINEVDSILNTADTAGYWEQMADLIRPFGRITSIVESATPVDLTLLMKKSATFSWELMFTRSLFQTEDMAEQGQILTRVSKWIEEKKLVPTLTQVPGVISAANIRAAHAVLESGKGIGKIVLSGW